MSDLSAKIAAIRYAPSALQKARALNAAIEAVEAAVGRPGELLKSDGSASLSATLDRMGTRIANIEELDRRHAESLKRSCQRKAQ